ncbi:predicted protein, partial [Nematostella vectensis]
DKEYSTVFWPKLEGAILLILKQNPGEFIPISYEEMYSTVYKCVCWQYSERMHSSLIELVSSYLRQITHELQNSPRQDYLEKFHFAMAQYFQAVAGIVAIFNYMNRFYVVPKLHSDLSVQLKTLFMEYVADNPLLFSKYLIAELSVQPFAVNPQTMMSIIKGLYSLNPGFAERNPALFAKYIPNLLPPSTPQDLPSLIEQTQQMQKDLVDNPDFTRYTITITQ